MSAQRLSSTNCIKKALPLVCLLSSGQSGGKNYGGKRENTAGTKRDRCQPPPGELVQIDTVHYVNPLDRSKIYIYTVIDLYSRMAYAKASARAHSKGCCNNNL